MPEEETERRTSRKGASIGLTAAVLLAVVCVAVVAYVPSCERENERNLKQC